MNTGSGSYWTEQVRAAISLLPLCAENVSGLPTFEHFWTVKRHCNESAGSPAVQVKQVTFMTMMMIS